MAHPLTKKFLDEQIAALSSNVKKGHTQTVRFNPGRFQQETGYSPYFCKVLSEEFSDKLAVLDNLCCSNRAGTCHFGERCSLKTVMSDDNDLWLGIERKVKVAHQSEINEVELVKEDVIKVGDFFYLNTQKPITDFEKIERMVKARKPVQIKSQGEDKD